MWNQQSQQMQPPKRVVGPLVKSQSLYLHSSSSNGYNFQANVNGLVSCKPDEIMRVSIGSLNVYNGYKQINDTNDTFYMYNAGVPIPDLPPGFSLYPPRNPPSLDYAIKIPHGNYQMRDLAALITQVTGANVTYNINTNKMTLSGSTPFAFYMTGTLATIMGFSVNYQPQAETHVSDINCMPHAENEIVVNIDGLSPHENAAPVDNFSNPVDKIDVGHVIAVIPVGDVFQRTVWFNNAGEFNSFFFSEKSVNTLRVRLTDMEGRPLTWVNNTTSISLLFQTYQIE